MTILTPPELAEVTETEAEIMIGHKVSYIIDGI